MEDPTVAMLATVAGIGFIGTIIVEVVLRAAKPDADFKDRFGPLLALGVGIVLGLIGQFAPGADGNAVQGILVGLVAGGTSMGFHDLASGTIGPALSGGNP